MIEVHFYNENNKSQVFFKKMMESPPRVGEEMEVLIDPSNAAMTAYYEVIHVKTTTAIFDTSAPEIKSVVLKDVVSNKGQVAVNQNQAPPQS